MHQRGLSRARRTHDRDEVSVFDRERNASERVHRGVAHLIAVMNVLEFDHQWPPPPPRRGVPLPIGENGFPFEVFLAPALNSAETIVSPSARPRTISVRLPSDRP